MIVSRETSKLAQYAALLRKWSPRINLVAPATMALLEARHLDDSAQLVELVNQKPGNWVDLGSGGGLPGLVIAILEPERHMSLVESDGRKCAFLRTAARELELSNVTILNGRAEEIDPLEAAHVSARALAPLPRLLSYVARHLAPNGVAWLMKGRNWQVEVEEALKDWTFDMEIHESRTESGAAILKLSGLKHV